MAVDDDSTGRVSTPVAHSLAVDDSCKTEFGNEPSPNRTSVVRTAMRAPVRLASIVGVVIVLALAGLVGQLGVRAYQSHRSEMQRNLVLQVARQGAVNLTTVDYQHADADVKRILESATGAFYDDFSKRVQPFIDVVKRVRSKSVGTVTEAGVESLGRNDAQVLVAVTVNTTAAGAPDQQPRAWRMRISVSGAGADAKVSNVEFVP
ncbi:Mce protein [Mycolicibacterium sp. CH28]|uniref:Mce protein n=1 Tax=Mycolicibacterium sp. CH28 TaxID=2512237 RepID=UPI00191428AE|nr:Mce protein [Mycolicibacterium sp. CH28]